MGSRKRAGHWLAAAVFLLFALVSYGQDCNKDCQCILNNARSAAEQEQPDFQRALRLFNAAKLCFPDSVQVIDREVVAMFERINNLKEQADRAEERARREAEQAKSARDLALTLQKQAEEERKNAKDAQESAEKTRDTLAIEKEKAQQQYLLAEARRLDNIATGLATDKKHTEAWIVGLHKWRELGDTLGSSLDSLAAALFEGSERILLRKSLYNVQDTADLVDVQLGARQYLLVQYRNGRVELQSLTGTALHTFRVEGLKKAIFSPDGSRVGLFSGRRAEVYVLEGEEAGLSVRLEKEYDIGRDRLEQLVFASDNEAFVIIDTAIFSLSRPRELAYSYSDKKIQSFQPFPNTNFRVGARQGYAFLYTYNLYEPKGADKVLQPQIYCRLLTVTPPSVRGIRKVKGTSFDSEDIHIAPSGRFVIGRTENGRVKYMDENGRLLAYFEGRKGHLEVTPYDKESGFYLLTHDAGHLWAWTRKGANIARMDEVAGNLKGVRFSPDNTLLFTYSGTEGKLWDVEGNLLSQTGGLSELGEIIDVAFSHDGKNLMILHKGAVVSSWEIAGRPKALFEWARQNSSIPPTEQEKTDYGLYSY
ncbi:MAG: hypothetical protein KDD06_00660 [Phaeodactylibacter sp.]|nr:hypothetical protein [Phaeodactylibacter sp.]